MSFAPPEVESSATPIFGQEAEPPESELDEEGYKALTAKQHLGRLLSLVVFVFMFPFVVVGLGTYRFLSLVRGVFGRKQD